MWAVVHSLFPPSCADDLGLDAAAVAASTGPLPPSYSAAAAPGWEEDEPYMMSNLANDEEGDKVGSTGGCA